MNPPVDIALTIAADLEVALGALADIAYSNDMTLSLARKKSERIYEVIRGKYPVDVRDSLRQPDEKQI